MYPCLFASDLHGRLERYQKLFTKIAAVRPRAVFLGGDLLPHGLDQSWSSSQPTGGFVTAVLAPGFQRLAMDFGTDYPRVFVILGNDDPRTQEEEILQVARTGLWEYVHGRQAVLDDYTVYGYACVPPTPFMLKDWERYDVSRFVDPGCISPEEGQRTVPLPEREVRHRTIAADLEQLAGDDDMSRALFLFHSPPYQTKLDRAALDGKTIDHAPLDVHVGSIAIQRFLSERQPLVSLHGHVHESARLTGAWRDRIGQTHAFNAAHDGPELALVTFDPTQPDQASRELV